MLSEGGYTVAKSLLKYHSLFIDIANLHNLLSLIVVCNVNSIMPPALTYSENEGTKLQLKPHTTPHSSPPHHTPAAWSLAGRNLKCSLALQKPWLSLPLPSPPPLPPPVCTALPAHSTPLSSSLFSVEAFEIQLSKMLLFELMNHFSPGVAGLGPAEGGKRGERERPD